jgi:hypothetical protein
MIIPNTYHFYILGSRNFLQLIETVEFAFLISIN